MTYKRYENKPLLTAYVDASFADEGEGKSTAGWAIFMQGNLIGYESATIKRVVLSSTEAECHALSHLGKENTWQRRLITEMLGVECKEPPPVCGDNTASIAMLNTGMTKRSRHYDIEWFRLQELIENKELKVEWVPTEDNLADFFTKKLPRERFTTLRDKLMNDNHSTVVVKCARVQGCTCNDTLIHLNEDLVMAESEPPISPIFAMPIIATNTWTRWSPKLSPLSPSLFDSSSEVSTPI